MVGGLQVLVLLRGTRWVPWVHVAPVLKTKILHWLGCCLWGFKQWLDVICHCRGSLIQPATGSGVNGLHHWRGVVLQPSPSAVQNAVMSLRTGRVSVTRRWVCQDQILLAHRVFVSFRVVRRRGDSHASGRGPGPVHGMVLCLLRVRWVSPTWSDFKEEQPLLWDPQAIHRSHLVWNDQQLIANNVGKLQTDFY